MKVELVPSLSRLPSTEESEAWHKEQDAALTLDCYLPPLLLPLTSSHRL
jgi:hypothetical protein